MKKILIALYINTFACAAIDYDSYHKEIHGNQNHTQNQIEEVYKRDTYLISEFDSFYDIANQSNLAIRNIVKLAAKNMWRRGYLQESRRIQEIWARHDGQLVDIALGTRDIGWFDPISNSLALIYELIEQSLGFEICHLLRLDDLKTINFGLRVAFRPCYYGYEEFYKHMADDPKYRALLPVIAYWATVIPCSVATYGIGYFFVCSPLGWLAERVMEVKIAPNLTQKLYNLACTL